jgi:hypothetical protein
MSGNGDVDYEWTWATGGTPIAPGATSAPTLKGDLVTGVASSTDPDLNAGLIAWTTGGIPLAPVAPSAPAAKGDALAPTTWATGGASLAPAAIAAPTGKGPQQDPMTWAEGGAALAPGATAAPTTKGDITGDYGPNEGYLGSFTWDAGGPALAPGATAAPTGKGDVSNPYAWQDDTLYLTSQPYPLVFFESFVNGALVASGYLLVEHYFIPAEAFNMATALVAGSFYTGMVPYTNAIPEAFNESAILASGTLTVTTGYVSYTNALPEAFNESATLVSGQLYLGLIEYTNGLPEAWNESASLTSGSLT